MVNLPSHVIYLCIKSATCYQGGESEVLSTPFPLFLTCYVSLRKLVLANGIYAFLLNHIVSDYGSSITSAIVASVTSTHKNRIVEIVPAKLWENSREASLSNPCNLSK
jgi:hypothetical protein